jgi:uncharacterized membrane protein YgdD (TMEM256/DUF423 family)
MDRVWFVAAGLSGIAAVVAGAIGAHAVTNSASLAVPIRIFDTAQLYHTVHSVALLGAAIALTVGRDRAAGWSVWVLRFAALAFAVGIVCFCGGIYRQLATAMTTSGGIVPFGGASFIAGWLAVAVAGFGLRIRPDGAGY